MLGAQRLCWRGRWRGHGLLTPPWPLAPPCLHRRVCVPSSAATPGLAAASTAAAPRHQQRRRRAAVATPAAAASPAPPSPAHGPAQLTLEEVLARCRAAVGEGLAGVKGGEVVVHGTGHHLGSQVAWALRFRRDGAFYEEIRSKYLTFKWGHDGGADSTCWEVDPAGVAKHLEYDDHESMLLALLVRSGCWLDAEAMAGRLEFRGLHVGSATTHAVPSREGTVSVESNGSSSSGGGSSSSSVAAGSTTSSSNSGSGNSSSSRSTTSSVPATASAPVSPKGPARRPAKRARRINLTPPRSPAPAPSGARGPPIYIDIALTGTRMLARVELCPETWRPVGFGQALVGYDEPAGAQGPSLWVFEDWRRWEAPPGTAGAPPAPNAAAPGAAALPLHPAAPDVAAPRPGEPLGVWFPMRVRHNAAVGGAHDYYTTQVQLQAVRISSVAYTIPLCTKLPVDAAFDPKQPAGTWAWKATSGHIVVPVSIAGMDPGYMLLDTGASGFVLQTGLAAKYGLTRFGRLNIAGLTGKIHTCFCRAPSMQLGPLVVRDPVFMEMDVAGLVRGLDPGIIGIAGYDVFRRAIFEFPTPAETAAALEELVRRPATAAALAGVAPPSVLAPAAAAHAQPAGAIGKDGDAGSGAAAMGQNSSSSSGDTSDTEMRVFDAGELAPRQRQLAGTAHAASVTGAATTAAVPPAAPAASADSGASSSTAAWGSPNRSSSSASDADSAWGSGSQLLPLPPPVPVPGMHPPRPGSTLEPLWLMIHNPDEPPRFSERYIWHPMRLIGNLPHAEITFRAPCGTEHRALFMVDSGAGGADLLFHGRATRELRLATADELAGRGDRSRVRSVRGVGGEGQAPMRVVLGDLEWADWGGVRFDRVRALFALRGGLDISLYSVGIIGGDLINRRRVVIDYPNKRIGILGDLPTMPTHGMVA